VISVSGLSMSFGARVLFRDVTFQLHPGRRSALVGTNGAGKTTLLELLLGEREPDSGDVHRPRDCRVGYLPQELTETSTGTVLDTVLDGAGEIRDLERTLHDLQHALASTATGPEHDRLLAAFGDAQHRYEALGGYALEAEANRILAGLGFAPGDADRPLRSMSGGWRMRAALARLLLDQPDVLILDEPTNHLDTDSVGWLEDALLAYPGAVLVVSHDRDFIDAVADRVVELAFGTATEYVGGFAEFVVQREDRLAQMEARRAQQDRRIAQMERFVDRFRYKATKARQVQSRIKTLEKLDRIEVPTDREVVAKFAFPEPRRSSRVVVELTGVDAGYDGVPVVSGVDLVVERGEKWALVGPNGAGKTTLLKVILGELAPLAGQCTVGTNVDVATFAQHQVDGLNFANTVYQEFALAAGSQAKNRNLRTVLGSFGFPGEAADRQVGELSGGERTRLALAKALVNPVNLLVLDEPTNHLDLASCDVLIDALRAYPGTVLLVTHDRYLVREVATGLVAVRDARVRQVPGVDEAVVTGRPQPVSTPAVRAPSGSAARATPATAAPVPGVGRQEAKRSAADKRNERYAATKELRRTVEQLERKLGAAEAEVADWQRRLSDSSLYDDNDKVLEATRSYGVAKDRAAALMDQWMQAQERLEELERRFG
jgi:ATP-binding cassette subfamily F protein 3